MTNPKEFDFKVPAKLDTSLENYLESKEQSIKSRLYTNQRVKTGNYHAWMIIFVLMISLIGLGTYSLVQMRNSSNNSPTKKSEVAGVLEDESEKKNIIPGDGFSLVLNIPTPQGFVKDRRTEKFDFLGDDKKALVTSFLDTETRLGAKWTTGIEVYVSEYDNRLSHEQFDLKVLEKLGKDFEIKSKDVVLNSGVKATKIQSSKDTQIAYYTSVTVDNYYLIKVYNQTVQFDDLSEKNKFTESLLQSIYLN